MGIDPIVIERTFKHFDKFSAQACVVPDSMPILYFGNYENYIKSTPRIVTAALNPSGLEFPSDNPSKRFANGARSSYLSDLSQYFITNDYEPYSEWFDSFEQVLNGMGASYFEKDSFPLRALHTDICTPIATTPTWNDLGRRKTDVNYEVNRILKRDMQSEGTKLWHDLIDELQPDIVIMSAAKRYLRKLKFAGTNSLMTLCAYTETKDGGRRKTPYVVGYRDIRLRSKKKQTMLVFAPGGVKPLAPISHPLKQQVGHHVIEEFHRTYTGNSG